MMTFDFFESVSAKGQVCTSDLFLAKTHDESLFPLYEKIAACTDKDEQQRLKKRLPGVTWQANFPSGRRVNAEAQPSGLYMIDLDGLEQEPAAVYEKKVARHIAKCDIMAVHVTPSCRGLRIVAQCRPEFSTIEENQQWLASQLGVEIDAACKDLARFSYLVPHTYILYWDGAIWSREPRCLVNNAVELRNSPTPKKSRPEVVSLSGSFGSRLF